MQMKLVSLSRWKNKCIWKKYPIYLSCKVHILYDTHSRQILHPQLHANSIVWPLKHQRITASIWMHITFASVVGLNETQKYDTKLWGRKGDGNHGDRKETGRGIRVDCYVREMCDVCGCCVRDVWWVFSHSTVTRWIMGPTWTYTYGRIAPDEENLNDQGL